jgi:hypothetical protein
MGGGEPAATTCRFSPIANDRNPSAIPRAPNNRKHPNTTESPRRISIRPDSMDSPTHAMAMTATAVASGPDSRSMTQFTADVITLAGGGPDRLACWMTAAMIMGRAQLPVRGRLHGSWSSNRLYQGYSASSAAPTMVGFSYALCQYNIWIFSSRRFGVSKPLPAWKPIFQVK